MKQRLITGIIAGVLFLTVLWFGGSVYGAVLLLLAWIGFYELAAMHGFKAFSLPVVIGYAGVGLLVVPWPDRSPLAHPEHLLWWLLFLLLFATVLSKNRTTFPQAAVLMMAAIYIGYGFHYMWVTRSMPHGLFWSLFVFVCLWACDSGAYFTGMAIGRTKLWPAISPKKTVEGAVGGILFAVIASCVFWGLAPSVMEPGLLPIDRAVATGAGIAVFGQIGDLIESAYKRTAGVKDSGTLFPGHGGVLDRTDSWIIAFPFVYLISLLFT